MKHRTTDPPLALDAVILLLLGQGILLIPHLLNILAGPHSREARLLGGFFFFAMGLSALWLIVVPVKNWMSTLIRFGVAASIGALTFWYAQAGLWGEAILLGGIVLLTALTAFEDEISGRFHLNWLTVIASLVNLAMAPGLVLWSGAQTAGLYQPLFSYRYIFGAAFLASAGAGVWSLRYPAHKNAPLLAKLTAVPWMGWSLFFALSRSMSSLLPALCFSLTLLAADFIPWERLKLPKDDLLGRSLILLGGFIEVAFLVLINFLLNRVDLLANASMANVGGWQRNARELAFLMNLGAESVLGYAMILLVVTINGVIIRSSAAKEGGGGQADAGDHPTLWNERIARLIRPFVRHEDIQTQVDFQSRQIASLGEQLAAEKRRVTQLTLLSELSQQLEHQLDAPVASQLAVNTLQRSLNCALTAVYLHDPERQDLAVMAVAGAQANLLPPDHHQSIKQGVLGRAARRRKTQVVNDARQEADLPQVGEEATLSTVAVPLIDHGYLKAVLEIIDKPSNAFSSADIQIAEAVGRELLRAWERSDYNQRLTELIQAGVVLATQPDPQAVVQEAAVIARQTLRARFTFVTLLDQEGNFTRTARAGQAPRLIKALMRQPLEEPLMKAALHATHPFRVRDIRRYKHASHLSIDFSNLRSLIAIPIRMHGLSVGAVLAFGKRSGVFFTENDESLASLLSSQAAAAIESAWLSQELRVSLSNATQLYQLSYRVLQSEKLSDAAQFVAETAQKVSTAQSTGIILLTSSGKTEVEVQLDAGGKRVTPAPPLDIIRRAIESGQSIFLSSEEDTSSICFPLKTSTRTYGALWLILPEHIGMRYMTNLQTLANQAAVALERSILLVESRQQAAQLEDAYRELELTYDHTLASLMSALDARDRETEGHSVRVAQLARRLGEMLNLSAAQLKALERGSLLHDIGKIGISDAILHKPGPLDAAEWQIMRLHPDIGARIVEDIPFLQDTLAIIRYHQERWDGSGYPVGLSGKNIPHLARIFAVADAFDALTSDRPYRQRIPVEDAFQYLHAQAGILFDPEIVNVLEQFASQGMLDTIDTQP